MYAQIEGNPEIVERLDLAPLGGAWLTPKTSPPPYVLQRQIC